MICRNCEIEFDPKIKKYKGGYINQCNDCSKESGDAEIKQTISLKSDLPFEIVWSQRPIRSMHKEDLSHYLGQKVH